MSEGATFLVQSEADALLAMPKRAASSETVVYPGLGRKVSIDLVSVDRRESFHLDIGRSYVKLTRATYQTRARSAVILARLDLAGAPHTNPDGEGLACPHLHLYREGFGDKWAYPLPESAFTNAGDRKRTLHEFVAFCSIDPIRFEFDLLS